MVYRKYRRVIYHRFRRFCSFCTSQFCIRANSSEHHGAHLVLKYCSSLTVPHGRKIVPHRRKIVPHGRKMKPLTRKIMKPLTRKIMKPLIRKIMKPLMRKIMKPLARKMMKPLTRKIMKPLMRKIMKPLTRKIMKPHTKIMKPHTKIMNICWRKIEHLSITRKNTIQYLLCQGIIEPFYMNKTLNRTNVKPVVNHDSLTITYDHNPCLYSCRLTTRKLRQSNIIRYRDRAPSRVCF